MDPAEGRPGQVDETLYELPIHGLPALDDFYGLCTTRIPLSGVETRTIEGVPVRLTSPAKTVADCFRYRHHLGLEVALAALRQYLRRPAGPRTPRSRAARSGSPIDALVEAAKADRIYSVVRPYLEALA